MNEDKPCEQLTTFPWPCLDGWMFSSTQEANTEVDIPPQAGEGWPQPSFVPRQSGPWEQHSWKTSIPSAQALPTVVALHYLHLSHGHRGKARTQLGLGSFYFCSLGTSVLAGHYQQEFSFKVPLCQSQNPMRAAQMTFQLSPDGCVQNWQSKLKQKHRKPEKEIF